MVEDKPELIKSVSDDQHQILRWIIDLYVPAGRFDLDPTYATGGFYKNGIREPKYKSDIDPIDKSVKRSDAATVSRLLKGRKVKSCIWDPPFLIGLPASGGREVSTAKITKRFAAFRSLKECWSWYNACLQEFYNILEDDGVLVVKCQDTINDHKQFLSHVRIINKAEDLGFYTKDLFILTANNRMIGWNHKKQQHARKFHSYFIVFIKTDRYKIDHKSLSF